MGSIARGWRYELYAGVVGIGGWFRECEGVKGMVTVYADPTGKARGAEVRRNAFVRSFNLRKSTRTKG